jgi:hypothetical protein
MRQSARGKVNSIKTIRDRLAIADGIYPGRWGWNAIAHFPKDWATPAQRPGLKGGSRILCLQQTNVRAQAMRADKARHRKSSMS